jgi:ApaG protein
MTRETEVFPYETETYGVVVRVLPEYLPERSSPERRDYFWRYTIEIENGIDEIIQLISRHWIITDAKGRRQEVQGDGVVGEQPKLQPGERYVYASGCPLSEPSGMMMGSYRMRREDGEEFNVKIPAFSLDSPHNRSALN